MNIGIGDDYPLSDIITSEFGVRGPMVTAGFIFRRWRKLGSLFWFGLHAFADLSHHLAVALAMMFLTATFKSPLTGNPASSVNTIAFMSCFIGSQCVKGAAGLYSWLFIPEIPRFTMDCITSHVVSLEPEDALDTGNSESGVNAFVRHCKCLKTSWTEFFRWKNLRIPIGISFSWFALDVSSLKLQRGNPDSLYLYVLGGLLRSQLQ
jgi:MFS transporter, PHS family, inorganic phosphate transporter